MKRNANRLISLTLTAAWCLVMALNTQAAGLSPIKVKSALGQPFAAEIDINGLPEEDFEFELAKGNLASPEKYQQAGLVYPGFMRLRITTEKHTDGKPYLKIASNAPINEPAVNLLIEFNWRGGRLMQKYSVLLDPPK